MLNSPGTIDADYLMKSHYSGQPSSEPFVIEDGERIAQMVIARHEQAVWQEVEVLDETERGAGASDIRNEDKYHKKKMNKKNSIWLLVAVWTLVSCGTVKYKEKPAVALAQSSLTPEQQRK